MLIEQTLMIADGCNLSCSYCWYETGSSSYLPETIDASVYDSWLERCSEHGLGASRINLTGGEPLLRDDLPSLLEVAARHAASIAVYTNGTVFTEEKLSALVRHNCEVHVSIDHVSANVSDRVRGGTKATLIGIDQLIASGIKRVQLCMVVTRHNYRDVAAVANLARLNSFGLELMPVAVPSHHPLSLATLTAPEKSELLTALDNTDLAAHRPTYYARLRSYLLTGTVAKAASCGVARRGVFIDSRGDIFLCPQRTSEILGNVRTSSPSDVVAGKASVASNRPPGTCVSLDCLVLV